MAQTRNKYDINKYLHEENGGFKNLPNFFDETEEMKHSVSLALSVLFHLVFVFILIVVTIVQGLVFPYLPKPELPNRNIEFKLVQSESKPPINKNTKIRSDRDSQAGGKHDPKKAISEPSRAASKQVQKAVAKKPQAAPQPKKAPQKQVQKTVVKPQVQKVVEKPVVQPQKVVAKPAPVKPSVAKPALKPTIKPQGISAPSAPKVVAAPKSPFAVSVPKVEAPVGSTYKPSGVPSSAGQASGSQAAPTPKFSSSGGSSGKGATPSGGQYASRGSYGGYGSGGNPSPGNPNGAPGIDAIKQPEWGPYMKDLEQKIKRNWTPPKGDSSKRVVITFTIGRDGRLLSSRVTKSSGVPLADRAAMSAIELTAPFRPLPPEFRGQSVPIEFTFDYNVINSVLR
ncbi:MAG: cell envelope integrity protein TolA [Candidatus Gastranaerophilales bacterium]|nr:cell envelope integrity protein TolA [Candidatus Gastranaerophilales bacterium]